MVEVSVIIPSYKPGDYIRECLDSLYSQTLGRERFEVILVLNGCDEPWRSQINGWMESHRDLDVRFVQTDVPGVSNARNIGLDMAAGNYIAFIDDDDYVSAQYLEQLLENSAPDRVALSDCMYFDDINGIMPENPHHAGFVRNSGRRCSHPLFDTRVFFNGPVMKLLHRSIIGSRRFDVRFRNGEDSLMMLLVSDRIKSVCFTSPEAVYFRRIRANSATTRKRDLRGRMMNNFRLMYEYARCVAGNPSGYDWPFVMSRFAATLKSIVI